MSGRTHRVTLGHDNLRPCVSPDSTQFPQSPLFVYRCGGRVNGCDAISINCPMGSAHSFFSVCLFYYYSFSHGAPTLAVCFISNGHCTSPPPKIKEIREIKLLENKSVVQVYSAGCSFLIGKKNTCTPHKRGWNIRK